VFTALLDTCVLWPSLQRDFLLSLAVEGMYRPAWNAVILDEMRGLAGTYGLPDPNDEHVVAAAVVAGAGAIVTANHKDFPRPRIPRGIEVVPPAEFAASTVAVDPVRARVAVLAIAARSGRLGPTMTEDQILERLVKFYGMGHAVDLIVSIR
jgi:hypothetical protein